MALAFELTVLPHGDAMHTGTYVNSVAAGSGISVSAATGAVTIGNTGVTSITGTADQVSASAATGAVTLSLPSVLVAPGSLTVTTRTGTPATMAAFTSGGVLAETALPAPIDASFLTLNANASLSNERVLTGTANQVILTDAGAGNTLTLSLPQSIATTSTPQFSSLGLGTAAGAAGSLIMTGQIFAADGTAAAPGYTFIGSGTTGFYRRSGQTITFSVTGVDRVELSSTGFVQVAANLIRWTNTTTVSGTIDLILARDAAGQLGLRNGTNAQQFNVYGTFTDASNSIKGALAVTSTNVGLSAVGLGTGSGANVDITLTPINTGRIKIGSPALVALGGGAAPTLGTIGGAGPATAAQNAWLELKDSTGAVIWLPVWK